MPKPIEFGKVEKGDILSSGIYFGMKPIEAPLWADGFNVIFREGVITSTSGTKEVVDAGIEVYALAQARVSGEQRIYIGGNAEIKLWNGTALSSLGAGFSNGDWSLIPWGSWLVVTNGVDVPAVWKNTGTLEAMTTLPFTRAKIFAVLGPHLLAFNTSVRTDEDGNVSGGETWFEWCDEDNIFDWRVLDTNRAGNLNIREFASEIVCVTKLGTGLGVYGSNSMVIISRVGGTYVFGYQVGASGVGAVSKRSVVAVGAQNYGLSRQGIFVTNGASAEYLDEGKTQTWIQENVNWDAANSVNGYNDEIQNTVYWNVPTNGSLVPNAIVGYNYKTGAFTKMNYGRLATDGKGVFDFPLAGDGTLVKFLDQPGNDGVEWELVSKPLDFGTTNNWKWLDALQAVFNGSVNIEVGFQEKISDSVDWTDLTEMQEHNYYHREFVYAYVRLSGNSAFRLSKFNPIGSVGAEVI